jgi:hypothetical protein
MRPTKPVFDAVTRQYVGKEALCVDCPGPGKVAVDRGGNPLNEGNGSDPALEDLE